MHYDYGFRIYNPAVGRFLSVDPLTKSYPMLTPYQFASNRPIDGIDLDGLEYDDSKLKIAQNSGKTRITIEGEITIKIKIINLSSSKIDTKYRDFHQEVSSRTFDIPYFSAYSKLSLDPSTGASGGGRDVLLEAKNLDINFEFIGEYNTVDALNEGDIALLLVNDVPDGTHDHGNGQSIGVSEKGPGLVYAIEGTFFNTKTNIDTHEKGHLIGDMLDAKDKNKRSSDSAGYLMSYKGDGYKLDRKDMMNLLETVIYKRALMQRDDYKQNTRKRATDFINEMKLKTNK